ncbi:RhoGAP-domain-containing protein [Venturia nashicola]|nr:RhoGAP-domain-containing protein [Venturia nashicola]
MLDTASSPFPDAAVDQDDVVYPCKGCGEILEEGKAFELAGNRWHIDCFRCNTCGTLLDSDANLLLLGDGSLICNNCTYSCSACNNKIEDLAILTGDQAFCANCFRCRNCKRKIDNLRYARTSQGIFCMSCHESLMARRRKNKKASKNPAPASNGLNKSLPELPRNKIPNNAFTPDLETPPSETQYSEFLDKYSDAHAESSPPAHHSKSKHDSSDRRHSTDASGRDDLTLPSSTFKGNRVSTMSKASGVSYGTANGDDFFGTVPLLLDTNPDAVGASPGASGREFAESTRSESNVKASESKTSNRDYFGRTNSTPSGREAPCDSQGHSSRPSSAERKPPQGTHSANQDKERPTSGSSQNTDSMRKYKETVSPEVAQPNRTSSQPISQTSPATASNEFKLQEAPRSKKSTGSRRNSKDDRTPTSGSAQQELTSRVYTPKDTPRTEDPSSASPATKNAFSEEDCGSPSFSPPTISSAEMPVVERPKRGDSLAASSSINKKTVARKELGSARSSPQPSGPTTPTTAPATFIPDRKGPVAPTTTIRQVHDLPTQQHNAGSSLSSPIESPVSRSFSDMPSAPPPRASSRPTVGSNGMSANGAFDRSSVVLTANGAFERFDVFAAPRVPPPPPPVGHRPSTSTSTTASSLSSQKSPTNLPRHSSGGDFTMEEEMERIMRGQGKHENGMLRKVSNAVKHGRSFSDRGTRSASSSQKWSKSPLNGNLDISSPTSATSPDNMKEENILMKHKLRQAQERIAKLEVETNTLKVMVDGSTDISQVNTELKEKRSTMAFLDTQREIVVRELEVMTEHLKRAKETNKPLDVNEMKHNVSREFAASLQRLRDTLGQQIEDLMQKRNELTREIDDLIQMKDKGFQEYESLSSRNHQLSQHNNELISSIQGSMKAVAVQNGVPVDQRQALPNGLGIYTQSNKDYSQTPSDQRTLMSVSEYPSSQYIPDNESESTIVQTPQVVKISSKGRPNMLKKGGMGLVKGFRKIQGNINEPRDRPGELRNNSLGHGIEGTPYNQIPVQAENTGHVMQIGKPTDVKHNNNNFGFFGSSKPDKSHLKHLKGGANGSNPSLASEGMASDQLFGQQLGLRCEFERRVIPCIVTRCIEEVELRGMDVEGVYRKSGGTGQVNQVRLGFEKDNDYDISDPDLDIHAVTSALKQYFRKLPVPLITFDVYDDLLDASRLEDKEDRGLEMKAAVNMLPKPHKDCLEFLVFHLAKVMAQEKENLMTPLNLAVVFAPTIMRPRTIEREMSDMQAQRVTVQNLLEMNQVIFGYDT